MNKMEYTICSKPGRMTLKHCVVEQKQIIRRVYGTTFQSIVLLGHYVRNPRHYRPTVSVKIKPVK
jgi:hypothetical protein